MTSDGGGCHFRRWLAGWRCWLVLDVGGGMWVVVVVVGWDDKEVNGGDDDSKLRRA